jgi:hypothetical protein
VARHVDYDALINSCVALCVLSGVASSDSISIAATGGYYSGPDHTAAVIHLASVDREAGKRLQRLVGLKPPSNYGDRLLSIANLLGALRDAQALLAEAHRRTA